MNLIKNSKLPPYVLGEIASRVLSLRREGRDVIDLSQFNPDLYSSLNFAHSAGVEKIISTVLQPSSHKYSSSQGISKLREAAANWYSNSYGVSPDVNSEVVVTLGTKQGLSHLLFGILNYGDGVAVLSPTYPIHSASVLLAGGEIEYVNLDERGEFHQLLDDKSEFFFDQIKEINSTRVSLGKEKIKALIVSFPNNPSTVSVTQDFYKRLIDLSRSENFIIINDFAYADIKNNRDNNPSILSIPRAIDKCIEFYSISKGFQLPGWRLGFAVGNQELITSLKRVKSYLDSGVFNPIQEGAVEVIKKGEGLIAAVNETFSSRREIVLEELVKLGFKPLLSDSTTFVWCKIPDQFSSSIDFCRELLDNCQVALSPGEGFGTSYSRYVRFALSVDERRLREAMFRINKYIKTRSGIKTESTRSTGEDILSAVSSLGFINSKILAVLLIIFSFLSLSAYAEDCIEASRLLKEGAKTTGDIAKEEENYKKAINMCPKMVDAIYKLGIFYMKGAKYYEAEVALKEALNLQNLPEIRIALANNYILQSRLDDADNEYRIVLEKDSNYTKAILGKAVVEEKRGRYADAENYLRQAIQIDPNDPDTFYNLGVVLEKQNRGDESIVAYNASLQKKGNNILAMNSLARVYLSQNNFQLAESSLKSALLISPDDEEANILLSQVYERQSRFNEGIEVLNRLGNKSSAVLANLGILTVKNGKYDEGVGFLKSAIEKDQNNAFAHSALGWAYLSKKNTQLAEESLNKALSLDPHDPYTKNNLGVLYELQGIKDKAISTYKEASTIKGAPPVAEANYQRVLE